MEADKDTAEAQGQEMLEFRSRQHKRLVLTDFLFLMDCDSRSNYNTRRFVIHTDELITTLILHKWTITRAGHTFFFFFFFCTDGICVSQLTNAFQRLLHLVCFAPAFITCVESNALAVPARGVPCTQINTHSPCHPSWGPRYERAPGKRRGNTNRVIFTALIC